MSAEAAWRGLVVALVVFAVLASGNLVRSAEGMPLGWQRSVSLITAKVVDRMANLFSLNRPYDWAAEQLGIEQRGADTEFPTTTVPTSPTTTALPPVRVPSAAAPLRVVVAGDSTSIGVGDRLKVAATDNPELAIDVKGKVSTGLTRADYFNWGAETERLITTLSPELYIFMVGANDQQSILEPDGTIVAFYGKPEWEPAYRARVAAIMDLAQGEGRRVMWIGEPNVGNPKIQEAVTVINRVAKEEAAKRPWVKFFDLADVVSGQGGGFSEYVTFEDGETVKCYSGDGVHLSMKCLDRAMGEMLPSIVKMYAPNGTTTVAPSGDGKSQPADPDQPSTTTTPSAGN